MLKILRCSVILLFALLAASFASVSAGGSDQLVTQCSVPGSPYRVAVEAPGRVWATLPAENAVVRLVETASGACDLRTYELPTANSEPYDIAYAAGAVWVTERTGNKIARLDPLTSQWIEYPALTAGSQPSGLAVLAGSPVQVWFAQRASNKLGQLTVTDDLAGAMTEYPLPTGSQFTNAHMEDVVSSSSNAVWFTLPGVGLIGRFNLSLWGTPQAFDFLNPRNYPWMYPGITLRPWQIKLDARGLPWFTEPGTNQLIRYNPNTTASFDPFPLPTPDSGPDGLDITPIDAAADELVAWYTARSANKVGRLHKVGYIATTRELSLPGAAPTDIAVDAQGCAWIAANGTKRIVAWCPPYFRKIYLPVTSKR